MTSAKKRSSDWRLLRGQSSAHGADMYEHLARARDIGVAAVGLALTSPILALAAVAIRAESRGPVLFKQERVGRGGQPFKIWKLRTMETSAASNEIASSNSKITRVGRFLRATKLDELPQLVNVLRGDMSLVGPRPELQRYVELWSREERDLVLSVLPGITDDASLAFHNEDQLLAKSQDVARTYVEDIMPRKLRLNVQYVRNRSLLYDLRLLSKTFRAVLTRSK